MSTIKLNEILKEIMEALPHLEEHQIKQMVKARKEEASGLLTDEGAAHIVANELGVVLRRESRFETDIRIGDLFLGMNDVSISGRVLGVGSPHSFARRDGSEGRIAKLLLGDKTGVVDVAVWDDKVDVMTERKIQRDETIRVFHAYVRKGLNGQLELNIGKRGNILRIPDKDSEEYPEVKDYSQKIGDIREDFRFINIRGSLSQVYSSSDFKRSDGTEGRVLRILLSDDTGDIVCVFWDELAEVLQNIEEGDVIRITGASVRGGQEETEVHTTKFSEVEVTKSNKKSQEEGRGLKIADVRSGMMNVDLDAWVAQVGNNRQFRTKEGREGKVTTILLADRTGTIRLNLWNEMTAKASHIEVGDLISVKNTYVRTWHDTVALNLGSQGEICTSESEEKSEEMPKLIHEVTRIGELKKGQSFVSVEGKISARPQVRDVMTGRQSEVKVAVLSLEDSTGEVELTLWGELAEVAENLGEGAELIVRGAQVDVKEGMKKLKSNVLTTVKVLEEKPSKRGGGSSTSGF